MTRSRNVIPRAQLREGAVECPLCGRQIAAPTERLVAFGVVEELTPETADAVECPSCSGVTFVDEAPEDEADRDGATVDDADRDEAGEGG